MKYSEKIGLSKEGKLDPDKVTAFFADVVGCVLTPVNNQYNSYWFSGMRNDDGSVYDLNDLIETDSFIAQPGDIYILNVNKIHSVIPLDNREINRKAICFSTSSLSFNEVEMMFT